MAPFLGDGLGWWLLGLPLVQVSRDVVRPGVEMALNDAEADEQDHADDEADDGQQHLLGGGFGLGFDGGGLVARMESALAAREARMRAPWSPARWAEAASSRQFVDAELGSEVVEDLPRGAAGEAGPAQGVADLGERPPVTGVGGGVEGGLESSAAGEDDGDQVEVGGQGVAEVAAATLDPIRQPEVRPHEAGNAQPDRQNRHPPGRYRHSPGGEDGGET